jgi:hypothetical protein
MAWPAIEHVGRVDVLQARGLRFRGDRRRRHVGRADDLLLGEVVVDGVVAGGADDDRADA